MSNLEKLVHYLREQKLIAWIDAGGKYSRLVVEGNVDVPTEEDMFKILETQASQSEQEISASADKCPCRICTGQMATEFISSKPAPPKDKI